MKVKEVIKSNYQQILFVFIAFLAMVLVSYFHASGIVRKQMLNIGDSGMATIQTAVSAGLTESELLFSNVVQGVEGMLAAGRDNAEVLQYLKHTNTYFNTDRSPLPDFMKVYAYIRGEFLDGSGWVPPADYVPARRPWYTGAEKREGKIFFSEPYQDAESGGICISFSQEVFAQNGVAYGILAMDLKLTRITEFIHEQQIAGNGYSILIDDKMNILTHRNAKLERVNLVDAGGGYADLARQLAQDDAISAVRFIDADGTDSIAFFRTVFNGWHIGVIIPRSSYYAPVYNLAGALSAMGLVLMIALSYMLVRTRVEKMRSDRESLSKSSFLARMSHEIRTPMNAIIGMTDIARNSRDPEKISRCLVKINEASNHLLGVINDVLDMSKIAAGKLELSETDFPFQAMLRQVETVANYKIEEKQQNFEVLVEDDVPEAIVADRQHLAQVITNLLSNANKFTPEGGAIKLHVKRLPDEDRRCVLQISVTDSGIGITAEQQARLFRSFEQADGSISRKYGGTGLGLAISRKIVELMDGKIWVESEIGNGASFIFTIRVGIGEAKDEDLESAPGKNERPDTGPLFAGKKILLAEDVEINREILITLLEDTGVEIHSAENGKIACDLFSAAPELYDMIFMDIHMPDMDGFEATKCIRAMDLPKARKIPIVAMTANVFREDIDKCLAVGMNDHVGKPLDIDDVLAKMKKYLR